jgi:hypothetical protein
MEASKMLDEFNSDASIRLDENAYRLLSFKKDSFAHSEDMAPGEAKDGPSGSDTLSDHYKLLREMLKTPNSALDSTEDENTRQELIDGLDSMEASRMLDDTSIPLDQNTYHLLSQKAKRDPFAVPPGEAKDGSSGSDTLSPGYKILREMLKTADRTFDKEVCEQLIRGLRSTEARRMLDELGNDTSMRLDDDEHIRHLLQRRANRKRGRHTRSPKRRDS